MASTFDQARKILKDLQSKAVNHFNKPVQSKPTNTGFKPWDNFANNTFKPAARTFGNAAINQVKNTAIQGTQSAYRQLQSGNNASMGLPMNFMLKKTQPQPTLQQTGQDILNQGNLVATGLGLPKLLTAAGGVALGTSGLLGGTFNKFTNGSFWEGAGTGVGMTPSMLGITGITNPLIEKTVGKIAPPIADRLSKLPLNNYLSSSIVRGLGNIPEGAVIDASLGRRPLSWESVGLDFATGLLGKSTPTRGVNTDELIKQGKALGIKGVNPEAFALHPDDRDQLAEIGGYILNKKPLELSQKQSLTRLYERYLPGVNLDTVKTSTIQKQIAWLMDINNQVPQGQRTQFPGMGFAGKNQTKPPLQPVGGAGNVDDFLTKKLGGYNQIYDKTLGSRVITNTKDNIRYTIKETGDEIKLFKILADKKGTGVGTDFMNALKEYADKNNKPLTIINPTNEGFWNKFGFSKSGGRDLKYNPVNQSLQGATVKGTTEVSQTPQTRPQPQPSQVKSSEVVPQVPRQAVEGTGGSSSNPIISQQDKYAFNINKPKLGLTGDSAKKLDEVVEEMRPVLEQRKGKPLTDDEIITAGRKAQLLDTVMGRDESKKFAEALQASRNFLKSESSKQGLSPEFLAQLEIVSSHASDKGRSLRAFAVDAEDAGIKQQVTRDLQKLGIDTKRLIEASKNVDWDNAQQVTEFYRKFKPAAFLEKLEEYRYANMLSSPNTQINNIFSNFLQSGIVTPVEKTLTGTLDFARSRLTGKEQKYFVGQGVDYANGYWSSLPQAWKSFRSVLSGDGGLAKPDIDFIPTGTGKLHKIYTTPLRALEATDQFFRTLVIGGESKSLQRAGVTGAEAVKKAEAEATYRVFRQKFDPDGKLGQGGVLKVWDKWNVGINHLRQLPGGKWIVPFLQTPTNILKQGVEYSPLGLATIPGSKEPMVQLSKAMIGSSVFVGAYSLADAGLTTWDTPINKKDKDAFYEAGLQPYSVKIGDKWVSYSKLGPLSYPIAMAAAMKWAKDNGADNNALEVAGAGVGGFLQFFADQSYMQGIGDVIDAVRGDKWKQGRSIANIPSQLIPYRALQGWAARLIDPVYRDISGDSIPEQAIDSIKSQVPFLSKTLDPLVDSNGEESKRSNPFLNAVSPFKMSQQTDTYMPRSAKAIYGEFNKLKTPEEKSALWEQMVKDKRITKENVSDIKRQFIDAELGITEKEVSIRNSGVADGTRAREVYKEFNKLKTPEEKVALWEKYVKAKIITKDVAKQLKYLLQQ